MQVARGGKRGKTAGRGGKGQTARAGNKRRPEWRDIIKKLPKLRGRGVNSNKTVKTNAQKHAIINLSTLEKIFAANEAVNPTTLIDKGVISTWSGKVSRIKILGEGEITKAFKVSGCYISESAKAAIIKAGGGVELPKEQLPSRVEKVRDPVRMKEEEAKQVTAKSAKSAEVKTEKKAKKTVEKVEKAVKEVEKKVTKTEEAKK